MPALGRRGAARALTPGEITMAARIFGPAIDYARVRIVRRRWFPFQPVNMVMAPCGHIHFHPRASFYHDDFAAADITLQGLFIHEMTHVWQAQTKGRLYLPFHRHPWCRYGYTFEPGKPLSRYGLEQQAEIVRHAFLLRQGYKVANAPSLEAYRSILPFTPAR